MITIGYKSGFIHENFTSGIILVQVESCAPAIRVKSFHAAKLLITKHLKKSECIQK